MTEEYVEMEIVKAKTTVCPECGLKIKSTDYILKCEGKVIGHLPREIFVELQEVAEKKGVPFETFFGQLWNGMMVKYLFKEKHP